MHRQGVRTDDEEMRTFLEQRGQNIREVFVQDVRLNALKTLDDIPGEPDTRLGNTPG